MELPTGEPKFFAACLGSNTSSNTFKNILSEMVMVTHNTVFDTRQNSRSCYDFIWMPPGNGGSSFGIKVRLTVNDSKFSSPPHQALSWGVWVRDSVHTEPQRRTAAWDSMVVRPPSAPPPHKELSWLACKEIRRNIWLRDTSQNLAAAIYKLY